MDEYKILAWYDMVYLFKNETDIPTHFKFITNWSKDDLYNVVKLLSNDKFKYVCVWKRDNNSLLLTYTTSISHNKRKTPPLYIIEF